MRTAAHPARLFAAPDHNNSSWSRRLLPSLAHSKSEQQQHTMAGDAHMSPVLGGRLALYILQYALLSQACRHQDRTQLQSLRMKSPRALIR